MQLHPDGAEHHPAVFGAAETAARAKFLSSYETNARLGPPRDGECSGRPSPGRVADCRAQSAPEHDRAKRGGGGPAEETPAALAHLTSPAHSIAKAHLGPAARPVRAVYFDKTPERNWSLGWHQDRTIAVAERRETPGFTDWTVKQGIPHCVPPFELLARTLTVRIHLDDTHENNAPLLVSPGTHRRRWSEAEIPGAVAAHGTRACLAAAGDVWAYATPILHASERARAPNRRRILQLLYAAEDLPGGLRWLGV